MQTKIQPRTRVKVLDVGGDLNASDMVRIKNRIDLLMEKEYIYMVLDLHKARRADIAGISILVERVGRVRGLDGDLKLAGLRPEVERVFRETGTYKLIKIFGGVQAAVRSFDAA